jgi:Flp pilus assembly protein TadD
MRPKLLLSLLLVAGCSGNHDNPLSTRPPGLDVADVALANGAPDTALHIAQQALAANPRDVSAMVRIAQAQTALGQRDQAAHGFRQALALEPNNTGAALGLGRLELASDPAAAAGVLLRISVRDQHNVAVLVDLGIARDLLGQHAEAQHAYRQALAVEPGRTAASVNLALSLALSGDPRQALAILRPIALSPGASPRVRQDLAVALVLAGEDEEAGRVLHTDMPQPEALALVTGYRALR